VWGENTGHGFGAAGSSSAIGVFGGLPGSQGLLGKPSTAVGLWGTTVTLQYPSDNGDGVLGEGKNGVHGRSRSPMDSGVYGENTGGGTGVAGLTNGENGPKGTVAGVWGVNQGAGAGVRGTGGKTGVLGECNGRLGSNGVHGFGAAEGSGVRGTGGVYGVIGEGPIGVRGESSVQGVFSASIGVLAESTVGGTGLRANASGGTGVSASGGLGGVFEGSIAPLQLVPSQIPGHPTSGQHSMGELYVDVQGVLWFCIASGTSGGTWKKVQLV
jgi:hypothetical protein